MIYGVYRPRLSLQESDATLGQVRQEMEEELGRLLKQKDEQA